MANPTTYFGWVMPTATDLVTDLPADFNIFGQGVDTSMQDLLGGTTGQVLSKASGTNMDFAWVDPDVIPSTYTAKTASYTFASPITSVSGDKFQIKVSTSVGATPPTKVTFTLTATVG